MLLSKAGIYGHVCMSLTLSLNCCCKLLGTSTFWSYFSKFVRWTSWRVGDTLFLWDKTMGPCGSISGYLMWVKFTSGSCLVHSPNERIIGCSVSLRPSYTGYKAVMGVWVSEEVTTPSLFRIFISTHDPPHYMTSMSVLFFVISL